MQATDSPDLLDIKQSRPGLRLGWPASELYHIKLTSLPHPDISGHFV
jgi:hypothetical protein